MSNNLFGQGNAVVFTENKKQYPQNVIYYSNIHGGKVFIEKSNLTYLFYIQKKPRIKNSENKYIHTPFDVKSDTLLCHAYKVLFINSNHDCKIVSEAPVDGFENIFHGNDPQKWITNVRSYNKITYQNLWNGIDLILYQNGQNLKYDFVVHPGANPADIRLKYDGIDSIAITENNISLKSSINVVVEKKPYSYQYSKKGRDTVETNYVLDNVFKTIRFDIKKYNRRNTLFIDPELIFSTYTGAMGDNWGFTATYDNEGNVYSAGILYNWNGTEYPVNVGAFQTKNFGGVSEIGIIKYDPTGTKRIYATYLGGSNSEMPHSMVVNSKNELIVYGTTASPDFPLANSSANNSTFKGGPSITYDNIGFSNGVDIFVSKISPDGSNLQSSTFLGGTANDGLNFDSSIPDSQLEPGTGLLYYNYGDGARGEVIVDKNDNVYIGTCTYSTDIPITGGFQQVNAGGKEGYVVKLNPNLSEIVWSSYIGGSLDDAVYSIDVDTSGNVYVTGGTISYDFPTTSQSIRPSRVGGAVDAFVTKINNDGSVIDNSSYWGSTGYDQAYFVRVDKMNHVYIYGQTEAAGNTLFINATYGQANSGQFVTKFNNTLDTVIWSMPFGTGVNKPNISPTAMSVDVCNRVYLAGVGRDWPVLINIYDGEYDSVNHVYKFGYSWSGVNGTKNMPLSADAYQKVTDGKDFYLMVIDDKASSLDYATYFGEQYDGGYMLYYEDLGLYDEVNCVSSGRDHVDGGTSRFDKVGNIYQSVCASCGGCNGFPTYPKPGAWSNYNYSTNCNNAVFVFQIHRDQMKANFIPVVNPCNPYIYTFSNISVIIDSTKVDYTWDFGDGSPLSKLKSPIHTYKNKGKYMVKLVIKDFSSCNFADSVMYPIEIIDTSGVIKLPDLMVCEGANVSLGKTFPNDTSYKFKWTPSTGLSADDVPNPTVTPTQNTTYELTIEHDGCFQKFSQEVKVFKSDFRISIEQIAGGANNKVCYGQSATFKLHLSEPPSSIKWSYSPFYYNPLNSGLDSVLTVNIANDTTIYVRAVGKICGNVAFDTIRLIVVKPALIGIGDTTICAGGSASMSVKNLNDKVSLIYEWSPANIIDIEQGGSNVIVRPKETTVVTVKGTSAEGCTLSDNILVVVVDINTDKNVFQNISCYNKNNASISIIPEGTPPYVYKWNDGNNSDLRQNLSQGTYIVTITDNKGCVELDTFVVTNPNELLIDAKAFNISCKNVCNGTIKVFPNGGTAPYQYLWNTGNTDSFDIKLCPNTYRITITDKNGCTNILEKKLVLEEHLPPLDAKAKNQYLFKSQKTEIIAIENPSDTVSYSWAPEIWIEEPYKAITTARPDSTITYYVFATDIHGCMSMDTVTIFVRDFVCDEPYVFIPNVFSPNGDKLNDVLYVQSNVLDSMYFAIYTRWGEKVFETNDMKVGWDGTYKGQASSPAVYVYYLEARCLNEQKLRKKGNITLLR